jgi:hypothetical protein
MKLSYRGINYDKDPSVLEVDEGAIAGKYRGGNWRYHYPKHIPEVAPQLYRQYRGVSHSYNSPHPTTEGEPTALTAYPCMLRTTDQVMTNEIEKTHLENLRRNLERRLRVAKESGNESLVDLLQKEYFQLC